MKKNLIIATLMVMIGIIGIVIFWRLKVMTANNSFRTIETYIDEQLFYSNPLNITQIGDPFVLKAEDGKYYCYPTSAEGGYKVWVSDDMIHWEKSKCYAYLSIGDSWGVKDFWAPEVVEYKGKYYMYYTARWRENNSLRIGVAVSDSPTGPFEDVYDSPMFDYGYAVIDANILMDDSGKKYLYFSRDCSENIVGYNNESHIYGIELNDDMITVTGEPVLLTKPEQDWELRSGSWRWNEGPYVFKKNNIYYLMYSSNYYASKEYSIGYATSSSPLGPFAKYDNNPIIKAEDDWKNISGPGHNSIALSPDEKEWYIVYHSHSVPAIGGGNRQACIDKMGFREDGSIFVNGPTLTNQLKPSGVNNSKNIANQALFKLNNKQNEKLKRQLTDGEISLYPSKTLGEFKLTSEDYIELEWDEDRKISGIVLYDGANDRDKLISARVEFSDGSLIKSLEFGDTAGEAAIACFDTIKAKGIRIIISCPNKNEFALSEIQILSY